MILVERIEPSAGNPTKVKRGRTGDASLVAIKEKRFKNAPVVAPHLRFIAGKSCRDDSVDQLFFAPCSDRLAVALRALPFRCTKKLVPAGVIN